MTNEVATTAGTAVATINNDNPFAVAARSLGAREGYPYLGFNGNSGEFSFGKKDAPTVVPHGTQIVADLWTLEQGYICWKDDVHIDDVLWPITQMPTLPPISALTDHGPYKEAKEDEQEDGWRKLVKLVVYVFDCEDAEIPTGKALVFNPSNRSPVQATADLVFDFSKVFKAHPGQYPVIELSSESYMAKVKKAGRKHACKLTIKGWISKAEFDEIKASGEADTASADEGADDPKNYETTAAQPDTTAADAAAAEAAALQAAAAAAAAVAAAAKVTPAATPATAAAAEGAKRNRRF